MKNVFQSGSEKDRLNKNIMIISLVWTALIIASLVWNYYNEKKQTQVLAINSARSNFNKDQAFRFWASTHGGVYVSVNERIQPNPYLSHVPKRDVITHLGDSLTLMNPAYMLRQMMAEFSELYGIKGRITSLKPLRPENNPDKWEKAALLSFEHGNDEVFEFSKINNEPYLRLIRPMITKKTCLKCHEHQGYKEGDVRGGVGISIPMKPYLIIEKKTITVIVLTHLFFWFLGLIVLAFIYRSSKNRIEEKIKTEEKLNKYRNHLEELVEERTSELKSVNEQLTGEIIERKKLEDEKIRMSKLEGIHEMVITVNHEMNQPLSVITASTDYLMQRMEKDSQIYRDSQIIQAAAWKLADLIKKITNLKEKSIEEIRVTEYARNMKMISLEPKSEDKNEEL